MTDKKMAEIAERCRFAEWMGYHCPTLPNREFKQVLRLFMEGQLVVVKHRLTKGVLKIEIFVNGWKG